MEVLFLNVVCVISARYVRIPCEQYCTRYNRVYLNIFVLKKLLYLKTSCLALKYHETFLYTYNKIVLMFHTESIQPPCKKYKMSSAFWNKFLNSKLGLLGPVVQLMVKL